MVSLAERSSALADIPPRSGSNHLRYDFWANWNGRPDRLSFLKDSYPIEYGIAVGHMVNARACLRSDRIDLAKEHLLKARECFDSINGPVDRIPSLHPHREIIAHGYNILAVTLNRMGRGGLVDYIAEPKLDVS